MKKTNRNGTCYTESKWEATVQSVPQSNTIKTRKDTSSHSLEGEYPTICQQSLTYLQRIRNEMVQKLSVKKNNSYQG